MSYNNEKIVLLSTIKKISYDSLNLILTDYSSITSDYINSPDSSRFYSDQAIRVLSTKYQMSKLKIASFIFSFKYEMLTKQDIIDNIIDEGYESEQDNQ